ncbi:MAG: hypothetical protein WC838_02145 [Candidatus Margulisiibacteriota bacterium]|jgi:hypothetical protein
MVFTPIVEQRSIIPADSRRNLRPEGDGPIVPEWESATSEGVNYQDGMANQGMCGMSGDTIFDKTKDGKIDDLDGDGQYDEDDVMLAKCTGDILKAADANGDGKLDKTEIASLDGKSLGLRGVKIKVVTDSKGRQGVAVQQEGKTLFTACDGNGDGAVDLKALGLDQIMTTVNEAYNNMESLKAALQLAVGTLERMMPGDSDEEDNSERTPRAVQAQPTEVAEVAAPVVTGLPNRNF